MHIHELRALAGQEIVDYRLLMSLLKDYAYPRNKINRWLKSGDLIRVKKGLYIFGKKIARNPYCKELLANLIYGPSAISLEYALSYYGLIPERVNVMTCITTKSTKDFQTPIGVFSYRHLHKSKYPIGIQLEEYRSDHFFLIASPEKALSDKLYFLGEQLKDLSAIETYLYEDLRIDDVVFSELNEQMITEFSHAYKHKNVTLLRRLFERGK